MLICHHASMTPYFVVIIKKRDIEPPSKHNCRLKCKEKLIEVKRQNIFLKFWNETRTWDLKRQFMLSKVNATEIQRTRSRDSSREEIRNKSYIYSFFINGKRKIICKTMYLNTLSIS